MVNFKTSLHGGPPARRWKAEVFDGSKRAAQGFGPTEDEAKIAALISWVEKLKGLTKDCVDQRGLF